MYNGSLLQAGFSAFGVHTRIGVRGSQIVMNNIFQAADRVSAETSAQKHDPLYPIQLKHRLFLLLLVTIASFFTWHVQTLSFA
jgi:hypothetical protein